MDDGENDGDMNEGTGLCDRAAGVRDTSAAVND